VRTVDDLSEVVARQDTEIARLTARVRFLMEREAEREADEGSGVPLADKPPPHW
jgi:SlyX protein